MLFVFQAALSMLMLRNPIFPKSHHLANYHYSGKLSFFFIFFQIMLDFKKGYLRCFVKLEKNTGFTIKKLTFKPFSVLNVSKLFGFGLQ